MKKQKYLTSEIKLLLLFILFTYILISLFMLKSKNLNANKLEFKLKRAKNSFFRKKIPKGELEKLEALPFLGRILSNEDENLYDGSKEFCLSASNKLNQYYITGDSSELDIDNSPINYNNESKNYISSLVSNARDYLFKSGDYNEFSRLDLGLSNSIIPSYIVPLISILWYFICYANACRTCCCCCFKECKDTCCIKPYFTIIFLFFIWIILVCLFEIYEINKVFEPVANTQCSSLKFIEVILNGEQKESSPKWVGIEKTKNILNDLDSVVKQIQNNDFYSRLNYLMHNNEREKDNFLFYLKNAHKNFYKEDEITPLEGYSKDYPVKNEYYIERGNSKFYLRNKYVLDLLSIFGKYHT